MPETPQTLIATVENFATAVVETSNRVPVLVDFWAPWCAPCRALVPVLDRIAQDYAGRLLLAKLNVDEEQEVAAHFGIRSIPTVLLIHRGQVVDQFTGVQPETTIRAMIERHVVGRGAGIGRQGPDRRGARTGAGRRSRRRRPDRRGRAGRSSRGARTARRTRRSATPGPRCGWGHRLHHPARRPGSAVSDARDPPGAARVPRNRSCRTRRGQRPRGARSRPGQFCGPARTGRPSCGRRRLRRGARGMAHAHAARPDVWRRRGAPQHARGVRTARQRRRARCPISAQDGIAVALNGHRRRACASATTEPARGFVIADLADVGRPQYKSRESRTPCAQAMR